jgi:hypothetical protein
VLFLQDETEGTERLSFTEGREGNEGAGEKVTAFHFRFSIGDFRLGI